MLHPWICYDSVVQARQAEKADQWIIGAETKQQKMIDIFLLVMQETMQLECTLPSITILCSFNFHRKKISIPGKYLFICWCGAFIQLWSCVIPLKLNSGIFDWFRSNVVLATFAVKVKMALWKHPDIWCWYLFRLHNFIKMAKYKRIDFSLIVV